MANDGSLPDGEADSFRQVKIAGFEFLVHSHYSNPIRKALEDGSYEGGERAVLPHLLSKNDRVLEVGSAIGVLGAVCSSIVGVENYIGYEANPKLLDDARRNFRINGLNAQFRNGVLQNRVIWPGHGSSVKFYIQPDFWASSLQNEVGSIDVVTIPTFCFENAIADFRANVLVCDIEGGEVELLEHADMVGITKIVMEIHYWAGREGVNRLLRKLIFSGFSIDFDLSGRSIVALHRGLTPVDYGG